MSLTHTFFLGTNTTRTMATLCKKAANIFRNIQHSNINTMATNVSRKRRKTNNTVPTTGVTTTLPVVSLAAAKDVVLPSSVSEYLVRLKQQKKELYKNPPVLPPTAVTIEELTAPKPKRNPKTGRLTFAAVTGSSTTDLNSMQRSLLLSDFHPNVTPEEILRGGAFGGTYFRSIHSAVTNQKYAAATVLATTVDPAWTQGLDGNRMLTSHTYDASVNKFHVKCGGSLGMWEVRVYCIALYESIRDVCTYSVCDLFLALSSPIGDSHPNVGLLYDTACYFSLCYLY
jgi:hypothetical protein